MPHFVRCLPFLCLFALHNANAAAPACRDDLGIALPDPLPRVLIVGEMHGTREFPAMALEISCQALRSAHPVILGLEMPIDEQERINTYLKSAGRPEDRAALLSGPFWQRAVQDGRSSAALAELIETVRQWNQSGQKILLAAFDMQDRHPLGILSDKEVMPSMARPDGEMALEIYDKVIDHPEYTYIALVGGNHAYKVPHFSWNAQASPMAYLLSQRTSVYTFTASHPGGEAWTCRKPAGTLQCAATRYGASEGWKTSGNFDAQATLGSLTASPPAALSKAR